MIFYHTDRAYAITAKLQWHIGNGLIRWKRYGAVGRSDPTQNKGFPKALSPGTFCFAYIKAVFPSPLQCGQFTFQLLKPFTRTESIIYILRECFFHTKGGAAEIRRLHASVPPSRRKSNCISSVENRFCRARSDSASMSISPTAATISSRFCSGTA